MKRGREYEVGAAVLCGAAVLRLIGKAKVKVKS